MVNRLEKILGRWAIPHLVRGIVVLMGIAFLFGQAEPTFVEWLSLDPARFWAGEVWRALTFILVPPTQSWFWIIFALLFLWMLGDGLEEGMGTLRLNLFLLTGTVATAVVALGLGIQGVTSAFLHSSLLLAFATLYPHYEILLFFILPVRMKWIGFFTAGVMLASMVAGDWATRAIVAAGALNYALFFLPTFWKQWQESRAIATRRQRYAAPPLAPEETFHTCSSCGATEVTHPDLSFRVARNGQEFCENCLAARRAATEQRAAAAADAAKQ
jgi:hypothetical protein